VLVVANFAQSFLSFRGQLVRDLVAAGHAVTVALPQPLAAVQEALGPLGVAVVELPVERLSVDPRTDLAFCARLVALMERVQPEVAYLYTIKPVIWGALAARWTGVPRVVTVIPGVGRTFDPRGPSAHAVGWVVRSLYRCALSGVSRTVFLNPDDRAEFVARGLSHRARTLVIPGEGVDPDHYAPMAVEPEPHSVLLVARMMWGKGVGVLAEAARLLRPRWPQARFRLLGPFEDDADGVPPAVVERWSGEGLVEYLGTAADVRPLVTRHAVFALPSHYREGLPRSVLEAMAMERPVITTDNPGCRVAVEHDRSGLLVPVRDPHALAAAIERLFSDQALARRLALAGRRRVIERFSAPVVNRHLLAAGGLSAPAPI
jgi:glycosyltransferase involved in cell wall biosynthesis